MMEVCLWLHTVVNIKSNYDHFVCICNSLLTSKWKVIIIQSIKNINEKQSLLDIDDMDQLVTFLNKLGNDHLFDLLKDQLVNLSIDKWDEVIKNRNSKKHFEQFSKPV